MRTSALFVALVLCWATTAFSQGFKLTAVSPRENAGVVTLFISTSGTPPVNVTARDKWKVSVAQGASSLLLESATSTATDPFSAIRYNTTTEQVEIDISRANLANIAVDKAGWQAGFFGAGAMSVAAKAEVTPGVNLKPAKSKDDSDIYVLGALIAGSATKPIWMVDAKGSIGWPTGALYHWFGVGGTFQVNPGAKPPADSSDVNPDSITFFSQMDTLQQHSFLKGFIYGYQAIVRPVGGEYASETPNGNITTTGQLTLFSKPLLRNSFVVDPFVGYEFGRNLRKPEKLFGRPVDLADYNAIARLLFGGAARYYIFQRKVTATDVYRLVLSVSWQARALGPDEPFVKSDYAPDVGGKITRQKLLVMNNDVRQFVEAGVTWNASPLVGFDLKYKRGSLPPLFQFVDPQVTVGVTFKAKIGTDLPR